MKDGDRKKADGVAVRLGIDNQETLPVSRAKHHSFFGSNLSDAEFMQ